MKTLLFISFFLLFTGNAWTQELRNSHSTLQKSSDTPLSSLSSYDLVIQKGHTALVTDVTFSKDGRYMISGSYDGTARLWDVASGLLVRVFNPKEGINALSLSADGTLLAVHCRNRELIIFDVATGNRVAAIKTKKWDMVKLHLFSDNQRVLLASEGSAIQIFDIHQKKLISENSFCPSSNKRRVNVAVSNDEQRLLASCVNGTVKAVDLGSGRILATYKSPIEYEHKVHFLPGGQKALITYAHQMQWGEKDNYVKIFDIDNKKTVADFAFPKTIRAIDISNDGKFAAFLLAVDLSIGKVVIKKLDTFETVQTIDKTYISDNKYVRYSPSDKFLITPGRLASFDLFNLEQHKRIKHFSSEDQGGVRLLRTGSQWQAAVGQSDGFIALWDILGVRMKQSLVSSQQYLRSMDLSPDGSRLLLSYLTNSSRYSGKPKLGNQLFDTRTGALLRQSSINKSIVHAAAFLPKNRAVLVGERKKLVLRDINTWKALKRFTFKDTDCPISVSPTGTEAIVLDYKNHQLLDLKSGKQTRLPIRAHTDFVAYLPNGNDVLLASNGYGNGSEGGYLELWDVKKGKILKTYISTDSQWKEKISHFGFSLSKDGKRIAALTQGNTVDIYNVKTGKRTQRLSFNDGKLKSSAFLPNSDYLLTGGSNGVVRLWNLQNGHTMAFLSNGPEWIVYSDDGYFDASAGGGSLLAAASGTSVYRIDQLATRYNRPDILLSRMGIGSDELIAHYKMLYHRRLQKMGLTTDALQQSLREAPVADIISVTPKGKMAEVVFKLTEKNTTLNSYNIYVNDVPIFGSSGKPVSGKTQHLTEQIELSVGDNKIEVSAINAEGLESMRPNVVTTYSVAAQRALYYVGFGVSKYKDVNLELKYAAKDAKDLETIFLNNKNNYTAVKTLVYTNDEVTPEAFAQAKYFLSKAAVNDIVVVFAAGHGLYELGPTPQYYFLTPNTELTNLAQTAAPFELLEDLLRDLSARQKLLLLDTCQSGEWNDGDAMIASANSQVKGLISRGIRRNITNPGASTTVFFDRSRFIYNDIFRRAGAIVFSASNGIEFSYERDDLQNGIFTAALKQALTTKEADQNGDNHVSSAELRTYVSSKVRTMTNSLQNPVVDRDNLETIIEFPINTRK